MHPNEPAQQAVLHAQEQFWQGLRTKDADLLATILAPDFVGRSPGEADQTRDELITTLTTVPVRITAVSGEEIAVHVFGEVAVLTGVQVAQLALPDGTARSSRIMLSNVFCLRDQGWRVVLSNAFELVRGL
jgi:ketosteroid isomerase-like protein